MRISTIIGISTAALALSACGGGGGVMRAELDAAKASKAKIAVVSISVNDYGGALRTTAQDAGDLIDTKMNEMLSIAETKFGSMYTVVDAASFSATDKFQGLSSGDIEGVYRPSPGGKYMPGFSESRGDLVKVHLEPAMATDLCNATGSAGGPLRSRNSRRFSPWTYSCAM